MTTAPVRIFVVGCPRSGTTLVQSMMAANPSVAAFPETHALWGVKNPSRVLRLAGVRSQQAAVTWAALPGLGVPVHGRPPRLLGAYVRAVVGALDRAAVARGAAAWSEKTPGHLRALDLVAAHVPAAQVVHVVRRGEPTVASLYAVTHDHGEAWDGPRSLDLCLTRWRNDLERTARWAQSPGQHVLSYESLVEDPRRVLTALVAALGLPGGVAAADAMLSGYQHQAASVTSAGEAWKTGVTAKIADRNAARADLLTPEQQAQVRDGVAQLSGTWKALPFL